MANGGKQNHLNLTSLLKSSNILDEDGIEDLHFYFVSFNQHKNSILKMRERFEGKQNPASPQLMSDPSTGPRHKKGKSVPVVPR